MLFGLVMLVVAACGSPAPKTEPPASTAPSGFTATNSTPLPAAAPVTTTPPGGRMNALFCRFTSVDGPYYVQVFNLRVPGKGMCTAAEADFTQEEFQAVPGLKRRCILDRDEQIAQKQAVVTIYSDGTPQSIAGARLICSNSENEFTQ